MITYRTSSRNRCIIKVFYNGRMRAAMMPAYDAIRDGYLLLLSGKDYKPSDPQYIIFYDDRSWSIKAGINDCFKDLRRVFGEV